MMDDGGSCDKCFRYVPFGVDVCNECLLIGDFSNNEMEKILDHARAYMDNEQAQPDYKLLAKINKALSDYKGRIK